MYFYAGLRPPPGEADHELVAGRQSRADHELVTGRQGRTDRELVPWFDGSRAAGRELMVAGSEIEDLIVIFILQVVKNFATICIQRKLDK